MKKRIICLLLSMLMLCSVVLTSCSGEKTEDEIRKENASAGDTAYTFSIWIPTNADSTSDKFKDRLALVQSKINDILSSDNTKIELTVVSDAEYNAKLAEKFAQIKADSSDLPSGLGKDYVNTAEKNYLEGSTEDYIYKLAYPSVLSNQLDICLIRDYATYTSLVNDGVLYGLKDYVTSDTALYPNFKKIIRNEFISPLMVNGNLYGIPNNRLYAKDEYQYILINKSLAEKAQIAISEDDNGVLSIDSKAIESVLDCADMINKVAELGLENVVPFVGTEKDAPGVIYWADDSQSVIVSTNSNSAPASIFDNEAYMSYTSLYKSLKDNNQVKSDLAEGESAGVIVYNGTKAGAEAYASDYYLVKTATPVMDEEQTFASMFAISKYSIHYDRAMELLYKLYTNTEIRTILQYGIEEIDYVMDDSVDEDHPTIQLIKDENGKILYDMNIIYTGNSYITYKQDGATIDEWDYVKSVNYDTVISKYLHFASNYKASSEDKSAVDALTAQLKALNAELFAEINAMTSEQFEAFKEAYAYVKSTKIADIESKIEKGLENYNALKPEEQAKLDKKAANEALIESYKDDETKAEDIKALESENKTLQSELDQIKSHEDLVAKKDQYYANATALKACKSEVLSAVLEKYKALYNDYNK